MLKDAIDARHIEIKDDDLEVLDDLFVRLRCAIIRGDESEIQHANNMLTIWVSNHTSTGKPMPWQFTPTTNSLRH